MLAIRISKAIEDELNTITSRLKINKSKFVRKALLEYMEDHSDYLDAIDAIEESKRLEAQGFKSTYTLEEVMEELDIKSEPQKESKSGLYC